MKIEIKKAERDGVPSVGDIVSLGNVNHQSAYLLTYIKSFNCFGAVNLNTGSIDYTEDSSVNALDRLISTIMNNIQWDEYVLIKEENVTVKLDCQDAFTMQNKEGDF